jgi:hypothetical protein
MEVGNRVKGIYCGQAYSGTIYGIWPSFQKEGNRIFVQLDSEIIVNGVVRNGVAVSENGDKLATVEVA